MSFSILGTGTYVPPRVVGNDELSRIVDTSDEWITRRVGVRQRRVCVTETASDLAVKAARQALDDSATAPEELDLIVAATVSGETVTPGIACTVQAALGASCPAFDINAACSAFLFMLECASGFFARGAVRRVLLVGAERMSGIVDWTDRSTCVIFGDGAGAAVLGEGDGYLASHLSTQGNSASIFIPQFKGTSPFYKLDAPPPYIHMDGQDTFKFAVGALYRDVSEMLERMSLSSGNIAWFVPHQANQRIIESAAEKLGIPIEKFFINIEKYGNTSSASIPISLDELNRGGMLKSGDLLILTAFGGGLSSASCLIRWNK